MSDENFVSGHYSELFELCRDIDPEVNGDDEWDNIRSWIDSVSKEDLRLYASYTDEKENNSALHLVCRHHPPKDIVESIHAANEEVIYQGNVFGWIPLHYAGAHGASKELLELLIGYYETSLITQDRRGRTPLHFAVAQRMSGSTVEVLCGLNAAQVSDENGSLPLHYACAYGASAEVVRILLDVVPVSTTAVDFNGRAPLHFAMGNSKEDFAHSLVEILLEENPSVANQKDNEDNLPLQLLAKDARQISENSEDSIIKKKNAVKCLELYLAVVPEASADFLNALKNLPKDLLEHAVTIQSVQKMLNRKITQKFPTFVLFLDGFSLIMVITCFSYAVDEFLKVRYNVEDKTKSEFDHLIVALCGGAFYYFVRELVQILSLLSFDSFNAWYTDSQNWLDVMRIASLVVSISIMYRLIGDDDDERHETEDEQNFFAVVTLILYSSLVTFLRSVYIDFAVFVYAVIYIASNLIAFLVALVIILLAFAQIFFIYFEYHDMCPDNLSLTALQTLMNDNLIFEEEVGDDYIYKICNVEGSYNQSADFLGEVVDNNNDDYCINLYKLANCDGDSSCVPYCDLPSSFLQVWVMMIGRVDETHFDATVMKVLYVVFGYVVAILLANVLIAIVTAYYGVVRNQRAQIVFWSNRLDFVTEMNVISSGFLRILSFCGISSGEDVIEIKELGEIPKMRSSKNVVTGFGERCWYQLTEFLQSNLDNSSIFEKTSLQICRVFTLVIIIPAWLILGFGTCGLLWPEQVREKCFKSKYTERTTKSDSKLQARAKEAIQRMKDENSEFLEETRILKEMVNELIGKGKSD